MNTTQDPFASFIRPLRYSDPAAWQAIYRTWQREEVRRANEVVAPLRAAGFRGRKLRNELGRLRLPAVTTCESTRDGYDRAYLALNMDLV